MPSLPLDENLTERQKNGKRLFGRGLAVYYMGALVPVGIGLFVWHEPFGIVSGLLISACILIAPIMAYRGSEGWKHFAGAIGMLMAMGSFAGGCSFADVTDPSSRITGLGSLVVFLLSCYIVKVFLVNDDVDAYMAVLRKRRQLQSHKENASKNRQGPPSGNGQPASREYSKDLTSLVDYDHTAISDFHLYAHEWIDNLHFLRTPEDLILDAEKRTALEAAVATRFRDAGWEGTGLLALLWLPNFVFPTKANIPPEGVLVWHVKQHEDGISWMLSPAPLPFKALGDRDI